MTDTAPWRADARADWPVVPLKAVAHFFVSSVDKLVSEDEQPVRLCNYTDVYKNDHIHPDMDLMAATASDAEIERFRLLVHDVVITKDSETWDDIGVPALVVESADDLVCGYHLAVIRPLAATLSGRFLFRCLQARCIRLHLELSSTGVTRFGLPKEEIGHVLLPLPPLAEQERIADYLDAETARMDALVAEKVRMLALLEEKRAALVSHAVTRGLNPNAPTKPSGLDWLGNIPAHWQVRRLKHLLRQPLTYGANEGETEIITEYPRFIRITDIDVQGRLREDTFRSLPPDVASPFMLEDGDILLARSGATVGKAFRFISSYGPACFAGYLIRCVPNAQIVASEYLYAFMQSGTYWSQVMNGLIQATIQNFSAEKYANMIVPLPPLDEQTAILAHLAKERARTAALEEALRGSITLLKERRAALIAAAVTGQVELGEQT